jgi:hypothetical protein
VLSGILLCQMEESVLSDIHLPDGGVRERTLAAAGATYAEKSSGVSDNGRAGGGEERTLWRVVAGAGVREGGREGGMEREMRAGPRSCWPKKRSPKNFWFYPSCPSPPKLSQSSPK